MTIWFHNIWCDTYESGTSKAFDLASDVAKDYNREGLCVLHDQIKEDLFHIKYNLLKVQASTPLEAYKILKQHLTSQFSNITFDTYSMSDSTTEFPVAKFLEPLT